MEGTPGGDNWKSDMGRWRLYWALIHSGYDGGQVGESSASSVETLRVLISGGSQWKRGDREMAAWEELVLTLLALNMEEEDPESWKMGSL